MVQFRLNEASRLLDPSVRSRKSIIRVSPIASPRAIALISAGSRRDLSFCCTSPGSTSLVSAPRRLKAIAAVSSTALSRPSSDADEPEKRPQVRQILTDERIQVSRSFSSKGLLR
jgi:hypothetical protein